MARFNLAAPIILIGLTGCLGRDGTEFACIPNIRYSTADQKAAGAEYEQAESLSQYPRLRSLIDDYRKVRRANRVCAGGEAKKVKAPKSKPAAPAPVVSLPDTSELPSPNIIPAPETGNEPWAKWWKP